MRSVSDERLFHTAKFLDTALRNAGEERDCDGRFSHILCRASVSVGNRRGPPPPAPKARAREEPEEVRDERRRRRAQYKNTKAALAAAAGRPHVAATAGRPQAAAVRAAAGRAWATRIACLRPLRHAPNTSPGCRSCASAPSPAAACRRELHLLV